MVNIKKIHFIKYDLSIIIPVYNSQNILPKLINSIYLVLKKKIKSYEIILINDCSHDNSW